MKIVWVVLFIAHFFHGLQVARAEHGTALTSAEIMEMAESLKSQELKPRFLFLVALPFIAVAGYGVGATTTAIIQECIKNPEKAKKIAAFIWDVVVPIIILVLKVTPMSKVGVALGYAYDAVNMVVDQLRRSDNNKKPKDIVGYNMKIINETINNNFNQSNPLNYLIQEKPEVQKIIHFASDGIRCNDKTCQKYGNGTYSLGVCTPYYCICNSSAQEQKCEHNLIFNPEKIECDDPSKLQICGNAL